ncbi:MAG: hypothetical protein IJ867_00180 [Clostridia bacterium]|nr:hypothetical protein [Clostridia bacterium]
MNKRVKILGIAAIVIIILIFVIIMIKKKSKILNENNDIINFNAINLEEAKDLENEFYSAVEKCYEVYKKLGANIEDFWIYMGIDSINSKMQNGKVSGVGSEYGVDLYMVKKYDMNGKELEQFPTKYLDGSDIQFEEKYWEIEPGKIYMIKLYSTSEIVYYYTVQLTEQGKATLKPVCYTKGEDIPMDTLENDSEN